MDDMCVEKVKKALALPIKVACGWGAVFGFRKQGSWVVDGDLYEVLNEKMKKVV